MLIGFSGHANAGKDTAASFIIDKYNDFNNVKFADKLKEIIAVLLGCPRAMLENREFKESPLPEQWWVVKNPWGELQPYKQGMTISKACELIKTTPRILLQKVGTECFREMIHPNTWVNSTFSSYSKDKNWVVTDVRFRNEADRIKEEGGLLIRIERPSIEENSVVPLHRSEKELDTYEGFDAVIYNSGTIDDLGKKTLEFIDQYIK